MPGLSITIWSTSPEPTSTIETTASLPIELVTVTASSIVYAEAPEVTDAPVSIDWTVPEIATSASALSTPVISAPLTNVPTIESTFRTNW